MSSIVKEILPIGKELNVAYTQRVVGKDNKPYIVFVHGFGSSREFFRFAFENPSLSEYSLISLDLIGFGESTKHDRFITYIKN